LKRALEERAFVGAEAQSNLVDTIAGKPCAAGRSHRFALSGAGACEGSDVTIEQRRAQKNECDH
jgi:hypothetical protein